MPITLTELEMLLVTALPSLTAIISIIFAVIEVLKSLNKLKDNEALKAERNALVEQNKVLVAECKKMRKQVALLIQKAVHIQYEDMTEVKNDEDLQI